VTSATPNLQAEWLESDRFGGFASGTASGERTRRYHALLLAAITPPTGRVVMVNGIEAWLEGPHGIIPLTTQRYTPDVVHPEGYLGIAAFSATPWPTWRFAAGLTQEILVGRDGAETVLRWRRTRDDAPGRLVVRPLLSGRDYHALHRRNDSLDFASDVIDGNVTWQPYRDLPGIIALTNGEYVQAPEWYRNFLYSEEAARGLDCVEDQASPGLFRFDLAQDDAVIVLRAGGSRSESAVACAGRTIEAERGRRAARPATWLAADSYLVDRGAGRTVIAGFPWFTDWGRDTFIAMRGLMLSTGRLAEARDVLLAWSDAVSEGMLPNRFPDAGQAPEYNAVDASLWFVVAVHELLGAMAAAHAPIGPDARTRLTGAVEAVLRGYAAGTRFGIGADADGLLRAGVAGVQLTWMDAKLGDWVVTPRIGKPVEVQALWINALRIGAAWSPDWEIPARKAQAGCVRGPVPRSGNRRAVRCRGRRPPIRNCRPALAAEPDPGRGRPAFRGLVRRSRAARRESRRTAAADAARPADLVAGPSGLRRALPRRTARARRRLSPGNRLAVADGAVRGGLAGGARQHRGGKTGSAPPIPGPAAGSPRHRRAGACLRGGRRRSAAHARRLPVPGLVARRVDPDRAPARACGRVRCPATGDDRWPLGNRPP